MTRFLGVVLAGVLVALVTESGPRVRAGEETARTEPVRIGMVSTLFRDTPESLVHAMMQPFGALMESQTGIPGTLSPAGNASHLGQLLNEDKVQIGVFHGVEFAWARQKFPSLKPLMIAVNQSRHLQACVVARGDSSFGHFIDCRGKTVAMPRHSREHCHLYLDRRCVEGGCLPEQFFSSMTSPPTAEDALDDVVDKVVQAAVIDGVSLKSYERRKPARFAQLKIVDRSETFPAAVVAYRPGTVDEATLERFREGMMNASKNPLGRQFMALWKLTGFEPVPEDYEQTLSEIIKTYPAPQAATQK